MTDTDARIRILQRVLFSFLCNQPSDARGQCRMSYDEHDAAFDEMFDRISRDLYPEHKEQAIEEFTAERLTSYYRDNSQVMKPAIVALVEAKTLEANSHFSASIVFATTAIELLLKATLLTPVITGMIHNKGVASIIVDHALQKADFSRYRKLLAKLYQEIARVDLEKVYRMEGKEPLLKEIVNIRNLRNDIIHKGHTGTPEQARLANIITADVSTAIVIPMLHGLGLSVLADGTIEERAAQIRISLPRS